MLSHSTKIKKKKLKYCNNCNLMGHNYRECLESITSYGIICYRIIKDIIEYIIIRRRFSFSYADFIRTLKPRQATEEDIAYIKLQLSRMTPNEHNMLRNHDFDYLWDNLWLVNKFKHEKDYKKCKKIYTQLIEGKTNNNKAFPSLSELLNTIKPNFDESEWGFPKGKRNPHEANQECALREFTEESGLDFNKIKIHNDVLPITEEYKSINNKTYRSIYYLARYNGPEFNMDINQQNKEQYCEVDKIIWASLYKCKNKFRNYYYKKYNLLEDINRNLKYVLKLKTT
jgi:ADP-ribose pyrophosphatase YjhB (NUDIX family)